MVKDPVLAAILATASLAAVSAAPWNSEVNLPVVASSIPYNQTTLWHTQKLDHFDILSNETYQQRYFVIEDFWKPPNGPVILHICGEYTCPGINPARLFPLEMAQQYGALVLSLEHRFFGESQPFAGDPAGPLATEHLAFSNSRQALADLAFFTEWFQKSQINAKHGLDPDAFNTWIVVGGSYPGALASWYRLKYPQMSSGSHSASGVVRAVLNFTEFDEQISADAGAECGAALRSITQQLEADKAQARELLDAQSLTIDGDLFYLVADSMAESMQYAHRDELCSAVTAPGGSLLDKYVAFVKTVFYGQMGNSAADYDSTALANPVTGGNGRSWWWFKCSEVAFWQVAPEQDSIRSQLVNFSYHRDLCFRVFGRTELPDVDGTNAFYGGNTTFAANTFWDNGSEDPWRWAGVQQSLGPNNTANVMHCDSCAHCQSLYTPTPGDDPAIKADRDILRAQYAKWATRPNGP